MDLLMKYTGVGSQYIDGLAYDRDITKRICRVMAKNAAHYTIKFHSGNNYDFAARRANSLLVYAEHLPYITDLMIGEGFNFAAPAATWQCHGLGLDLGCLDGQCRHAGHGG